VFRLIVFLVLIVRLIDGEEQAMPSASGNDVVFILLTVKLIIIVC
jgi:hypothetical protein